MFKYSTLLNLIYKSDVSNLVQNRHGASLPLCVCVCVCVRVCVCVCVLLDLFSLGVSLKFHCLHDILQHDILQHDILQP